jgi:hypothetical protein
MRMPIRGGALSDIAPITGLPEGRYYAADLLMEGTASLVPMLAIDGEGGQQKPPDKYVSPASLGTLLVGPWRSVIAEFWPPKAMAMLA